MNLVTATDAAKIENKFREKRSSKNKKQLVQARMETKSKNKFDGNKIRSTLLISSHFNK